LFQTLLDLFDMSYNYKNYRTNLQSSTPPIIPYMGLYPKDITSLEEYPTILEDGVVNFTKLRDLWRIVNQMRPYQNSKYRVDVVPELHNYLKKIKVFTDKELFDISEQHETPKNRRKVKKFEETVEYKKSDPKENSDEKKGVNFRNTLELREELPDILSSSGPDTSELSEEGDEDSEDMSSRIPNVTASIIMMILEEVPFLH